MCTLIALHRCVPGAPLVVAANRDEFRERPAAPPALRRTPAGLAVMPLDLRAGGTWLGLNASGLFAAVTNRRGSEPDPGRRSRGLLVIDALDAASAAQARERLETLEPDAYNPFNLFVADRDAAFALTCGESAHLLDLAPGVHVVGNVDPRAASPKTERLAKKVERAASARPEQILDALAAVCREHDGDGDPLQDACVHAGGYGTRSSTLLCLSDDASQSTLRFAAGNPCRSDYADFTPLLRGLTASRGTQL